MTGYFWILTYLRANRYSVDANQLNGDMSILSSIPTTLICARRDILVFRDASDNYRKNNPLAKIVAVDDDHFFGAGEAQSKIAQICCEHLGIG